MGPIAAMVILPIVAGTDGAPRTADIFGSVHRAAASFCELAPMSIDEFYSSEGDELTVRAARCGGEVGCVADAVRGIRVGTQPAGLALVVVLNLEVQPAIVSADLIDAHGKRSLAKPVAAVDGPSALLPTIEAVARRAFAGAGFVLGGRVLVHVDPPDAIVVVDGTSIELPNGRPSVMRPGHYRLRGSAAGRASKEIEIDVIAEQLAETNLVLENEPSIASSPWLWIGIGAAVVVGGAVTAGVLLGRSRCQCISSDGISPCVQTCPDGDQ